ncbi:endonuclease/exonuclease/phosphatase family protein [Streptomyces sp. NPDC057445]|uniref:endonuclease/exonuclease/phosphatase family protein n=1 Tax=Streptomyces sp. NPDC057445 TaxID=3346136 RepID=UPI003680B714
MPRRRPPWSRRGVWERKGDGREQPWWERGRVPALVAVANACLLVFHSAVPNEVGRSGSFLETFLPWLGLTVPVLLCLALMRRSVVALTALLLPVVAWIGLFGERLLPGPSPAHAHAHDVTVLQHNVSDENPDPAGTARALARSRAGLIALEELTPSAVPAFSAVLGRDYPHHAVVGTVGLWSRHPLSDVRPVDIRPEGIVGNWNRGLRATARMPGAEVAVYVAHLPSVRLGVTSGFSSARRDESAVLLGAALSAERLDRVILMGDLNSTSDDRGLDPIASRLSVPDAGFAFSWPAAFPLARIDQIMTRSATVTDLRSLPRTGSDHLPVAARVVF